MLSASDAMGTFIQKNTRTLRLTGELALMLMLPTYNDDRFAQYQGYPKENKKYLDAFMRAKASLSNVEKVEIKLISIERDRIEETRKIMKSTLLRDCMKQGFPKVTTICVETNSVLESYVKSVSIDGDEWVLVESVEKVKRGVKRPAAAIN